jgi:hypothetical protein
MKRHLLLAAAALGMTATAASADCAAEIEALSEGVSKDGSMAPLAAPATPQTGESTAAAGSAGSADAEGEIAKEGSTAPLEADPSVATSAEDAQAQSQGGETAAQQAQGAAGGEGGGTMRAEALARAQTALDAGDEAGCMEAVEEAKGL